MDILNQIQSKYGGVRYRTYVMILCPFHDDNHESLQVHADYAHCLACNKRVPTTKLLTPNIMLPKRVKTRNFQFSNPFSLWKSKGETLAQSLKIAFQNNSQSPSFYLQKRGISAENQKKFGLGRRDDWITFPFRDRKNKVNGATARAGETNTSQAKYVNPFGQNPDLFYVPDWSLLDGASKVYITFGILDALSLAILGKPAMSTTTGKSANSNVLEWCRSDIIVIPDQNEEQDAYRLARSLGLRGKVYLPDYPKGTKDINDLFVRDCEALQCLIS